MEKLTFEESIKELEQLVKDLEGTELTLDESIEKFEKGMKLSKHCSKQKMLFGQSRQSILQIDILKKWILTIKKITNIILY